MSQNAFMELMTDFLFSMKETIGFDTSESTCVLPHFKHMLLLFQHLHLNQDISSWTKWIRHMTGTTEEEEDE